MQIVKHSDALNRGRKTNELHCFVWLLSMSVTIEINQAMQEFTSIKYLTSNQHKELSLTRLQRDLYDEQEMSEFLIERDLFEIHPELINLNSGEVADKSTNLYKAHDM